MSTVAADGGAGMVLGMKGSWGRHKGRQLVVADIWFLRWLVRAATWWVHGSTQHLGHFPDSKCSPHVSLHFAGSCGARQRAKKDATAAGAAQAEGQSAATQLAEAAAAAATAAAKAATAAAAAAEAAVAALAAVQEGSCTA